ncbi:phosphoribosylglycinamide formyltransferase [bacterium]|nr:phosphoribosylglycinamide formyltransferase [bacterium]MCK4436740.1 phosphoribosylglycinamide formyltransferase [bacterium]
MGAKKINLAVLLSGGGRTLQNIIDHIGEGKLDARIVVVISSRDDAYGLVRAKKAGIETHVVSHKLYKGDDTGKFSLEINKILSRYPIDLIVMAGFMHIFKADERYKGRVMNIHPALIPSFCGKGYYGHHVHQAVLDYGAKVSGVTVHFVDDVYDRGPIILQTAVAVKDDDTPDTLAARVFEQECNLYPKAIQLFAEGRLEIKGRRICIRSK